MPGPDDERTHLVRDVVEQLLGTRCGGLLPAAMGRSASTTYLSEVAGNPIVVKTTDAAGRLADSERNLETLRSLGLPVPKVLGFHRWSGSTPVEVLIMERLPGRDLHYVLAGMTQVQMTALAAQIIGAQRRVASLPKNTGCGFVAIGQPATRDWEDVVRHPNGYALADPVPKDSVELVDLSTAAIDAATWYLRAVEPVCFLDDVTTKNVLIDHGALTGLVDFDVVCYGDPVFHIGLTAAAVAAHAPRRCRFYVDELVRVAGLSDVQQGAVNLYEGVFLVNFLANESPLDEGPWRVPAVAAARASLTEAADFFGRGVRPGPAWVSSCTRRRRS